MKDALKMASVVVLGSIFLYNCEPDPDKLGEQFFLGSAAQGNDVSYDIIGYNNSNNDSIRSDAGGLFDQLAPLGAFNEPIFGMQKASYVSQVRMASYAPDFGDNPVVDSAVLVLKPRYATDSLVTTTDENYVFPDGNVAAKKVVNSYPVIKYGKSKIEGNPVKFNIRVHEVNDFLESNADAKKSNHSVNYGTLLGSTLFNGRISSVSITKKSDNSALWSNDVSLRIPLSASYFQSKIIAKEGAAELNDVATFIRYFKGVRISVDETDGYIFRFGVTDPEIVMYYKKDAAAGSTPNRIQSTFRFPLGSNNVHLGQYDYNRTGTNVAAQIAARDTINGDPKLFIQGMGGPSVRLKIPDATIATLRDKYKNEKIGIISAKFRLYTDQVLWNNSYTKPASFIFNIKNAKAYIPDVSTLMGAPNFALVKSYDMDKNPAYYDFTITKSLKDIIEKEAKNKVFEINVGDYVVNSSTNQFYGYSVTSRAFTPNRLVFVGTDASNSKKAQLKLIYGTK